MLAIRIEIPVIQLDGSPFKIADIEYFPEEEVPYPLDKVKIIIGREVDNTAR